VGQASKSERVNGIVLNLSGLQVSPEQAWELRTALREAPQPYVEAGPTMTLLQVALERQPGPLVLLPPDDNPRDPARD